jgi:energy-coupling factor transporter ATP-binding protein EcfA2
MYLRSLTLKNVKRFRDLTLSFERPDGSARLWTVVIGENGTGKTTLLQAIALAASGRDRAIQLIKNPARFRSIGSEASTVEIEGVFKKNHHTEFGLLPSTPKPDWVIRSPLRLAPTDEFFQGASGYRDNATQTDGNPVMPLEAIRFHEIGGYFVAGYGVRRFLPPYERQFTLDNPSTQRLETLFDKGELIATKFNEILGKHGWGEDFLCLLKNSFSRTHDLLPGVVGLELNGGGQPFSAKSISESHKAVMRHGPRDVRVPTTSLSQGYQAIIAWITDLLGHAALDAEELVPPEELRGLVLIDELDLFLHPRWQVTLVKSLKALFPQVQFVTTTHSPLVLTGLEPDEIVRLVEDDDGNIVESPDKRHPALMTGSQLYETFFGVDELFPNSLGEQLRRFSYLSSDPYRTDEEDAEMRSIQPVLKQHGVHPDWEPVERKSIPAAPSVATSGS